MMETYTYDASSGHAFLNMILGSNTHKFTGKERDSESGLGNFGARYDSSQYGRFMTPDGSAKPTSVPYAVFNNPQSLNLYAYVQNNPVTNKDPNGHWCLFGKWGSTCTPPPPAPPTPAIITQLRQQQTRGAQARRGAGKLALGIG